MSKRFICSYDYPIVTTKAGRLRGFQFDDTFIFQGIKYCDAKRFQMPTPVEPWDGVKDATSYGYVAPLMSQDQPSGEIAVPHRYWPMDEHCQYLNIWTQSLDPTAKKPVMVWLHGGGFFAGSSIEQVAYDGTNMSKYGDVVVVSLNHRLNILGYLDLSPFGEKYKNSSNAGNADMVAALQWIHDNIEAFGGDPDNVTLFGQSGGGMKIWTLMQTPAAHGLFHKGIIQSGILSNFMPDEPADGTAIVTALMKELALQDVSELETIPYTQLADAYLKVSPALKEAGKYVGGNPDPNGWYLGDPRVVGFCDHAKTIPVMIGTVLGEFLAFGPGIPGRHTLTEEAQTAILSNAYGEAAPELIRSFKKAYPDKPLVDLLTLDSRFRAPTKDFIRLKAQHQEAPTYSYLFTYELPLDDGKSPWHCSEIPFVFHNTELVPYCNVPGESDLLEERMFNAWIQFARTGREAWPPCTPGDEVCMLFDKQCEVRHNHDDELIALHKNATLKLPKDIAIQH